MLLMGSHVVQDHVFELLLSDDTIVINVMLVEDLINFVRGQVVTQLSEGVTQRCRLQLVLVLGIEFLEQRG